MRLPASVERVCAGAFRNCTQLRAVAFVSGSRLQEIEDRAFSKCEALREVELPAALETLGVAAFVGCGRLARVAFAAGSRLRVVEESAFERCAALQEVTLPAGVVVAPDAFEEGVRVVRE